LLFVVVGNDEVAVSGWLVGCCYNVSCLDHCNYFISKKQRQEAVVLMMVMMMVMMRLLLLFVVVGNDEVAVSDWLVGWLLLQCQLS